MSIRFNPPFRLRHVFSSKIIAPNRGSWGFLKRTPEVLTNLSCGRFVFYWGIEEGIEVLAKPIFVRGVSPFYGWHAPCLAGTPRAPFNGSNAAHFLWKRDALCPFAGGDGIILKLDIVKNLVKLQFNENENNSIFCISCVLALCPSL